MRSFQFIFFSLTCLLFFTESLSDGTAWLLRFPQLPLKWFYLRTFIWFVCLWRQHWVSSGRALKSWILTVSISWLLKSAVTIKKVSDGVFMQFLQMLGVFSPTVPDCLAHHQPPCVLSPFIPWCLQGTVFTFYWVNRFPFVYDCDRSCTNIGHSSQSSDKVSHTGFLMNWRVVNSQVHEGPFPRSHPCLQAFRHSIEQLLQSQDRDPSLASYLQTQSH